MLIATEARDWAHISATPILRELSRYVEPVFIEIPPQPPHRSGCEHMGIGHEMACRIAYAEKAYGMVLTPDCMLSDGTVERLQDHAEKGIELVWAAALRFGQEPFLGHLRASGVLPDESRQNSAKALTISGRQMVLAAVNGMHSETLSYEWEAPYFVAIPSAVWWRVPGENGIVLHSLSWAPMLLDFGAVKAHDISALERWTIDGDYAFKNLGLNAKTHVVQDSDEMFIGSWGPLSDRPFDLKPRFTSSIGLANSLAKGRGLREAFNGPFFDPLKRKSFFSPVRWHANPLNKRWSAVERKAQRTLRFYLLQTRSINWPPLPWRRWLREVPKSAVYSTELGILKRFCSIMAVPLRITIVLQSCWIYRSRIGRRLKKIARGDSYSRQRALRTFRVYYDYVLSGRLVPTTETSNIDDCDDCEARHALSASAVS